MVKALLITSDFPPGFSGGISRYYYSFARELADQIVVMSPQCSASSTFDIAQPFPIIRLQVPVGRALLLRFTQTMLLGLQAILWSSRIGADLILWGHWYLVLAAIIVHVTTHLPFGVFLHGGELNRFRRQPVLQRVIVSLINYAALIVVNSDYTRQEYVGIGVSNKIIHKVSPGVDTNRFRPGINCSTVLEKYDLDGRKVLLTISRLVERKGHDQVIKALPKILEKVPQTIYLIVGTGPQESHLRSLAYEIGVAAQVLFAGFVPEEELSAYYNACDVFVMPSRQTEGREGIEGFGIVYLEANACGKPAIGGNSGGVSDAVIDGITGLLVDPLSKQAVADAVIRLLLDGNLARQMGKQGREIVERDCTWNIQSRKLHHLLQGSMSR